jgi:hypothetical protein
MTQPDTDNQPESEEGGPSESTEDAFLRRSFRWLTLSLTTIGAIVIWLLLAYFFGQQEPWFMKIVREHFAALFGIPVATMIALAVVLVLRLSAGPIEFEFSMIKLRGAAGEVLFWVICFLSVTFALGWLW